MRCLPRRKQKDNLHQLWEDFFDFPEGINSNLRTEGSLAPVDIESDDHTVYITTELPGIEKDKINIEYDRGVVYIKGEKEEQVKRDEKNSHYQEISRGKVERRIQVGDVDFDNAKASYKNGHLELSIPKLEESKAKRLTIN